MAIFVVDGEVCGGVVVDEIGAGLKRVPDYADGNMNRAGGAAGAIVHGLPVIGAEIGDVEDGADCFAVPGWGWVLMGMTIGGLFCDGNGDLRIGHLHGGEIGRRAFGRR